MIEFVRAKPGLAALACAAGWALLRYLFGTWGLFGLIESALGLGALVLSLVTINRYLASQKAGKAAPTGAPADGPTGRLQAAWGGDVDTIQPAPPFLTAASAIFGSGTVYYRGDSGQVNYIPYRALDPQKPLDVWRAIRALNESATFERMRRGYAIQDETGKRQFSPYHPEGYIVEQLENDDGSIDAVVAYDAAGSLDSEDYAKAMKAGLGGTSEGWKGSLDKRAYTKRTGVMVVDIPKEIDGWTPVFKVQMKRVGVSEGWRSDNPFEPRSTEKGAAQFAWIEELSGTTAVAPMQPGSGVAGALLGTFSKGDWVADASNDRKPIFTTGEGHRMIVGSPGSGKFTAAIAPLLLTADAASIFVFDVANGEAARRTAGWRSTLGPVLVLDPFGVSGLPSGALNPLDSLKADDPDVLQAGKRLADAIFVPAKGGENADYFNEQAREVLTAYLLHVATSQSETDRTLRRVRELIRRPIDGALLAAMEANPVAGGTVRDMAANLIHASQSDAEKNTFFVTQTLRANTAFLDLPAVIRATERTTFDPADLRTRVSTLYVCLPEAELAQVGRWLRLIYTTIMGRVRRAGGVPLHVAIDEFPALGRFNLVRDDMALVRKFGIQLHIATQSLVQLEGLYDKDWQSFMANAKYQQLLGANDHMTTEYFSKRLGMTTRRGTSSSHSRSEGGGSQSSSDAWHADALLSPDELGRLDRSELIVVVEGMNPLRLRKANYYELPALSKRADLPLATSEA